ncbi:Enoyl-CoA hydratase 2, peroxisomal [Thalictrum thalictroides]|uniref:Enoyl-CoA hydratase 2, peroxisomal n=1 Tax=Thalictrum thalictroides TaxID=46969 RepID=A0A7J6V8Z9_THATH|nr:Enoyl-CoA hydratase 2, peroxisomal [Thalictrum thalictroides]
MASTSIDPELIVAHKFPETTFTYTERDVALYALGIGACGGDAVDEKELKYVYHKNGQPFVKVLPTFATVITFGAAGNLHEVPGLQFDPRLLLHGQQYIEIYKPFPSSACIQNRAVVAGLHDKGKATVIEVESISYDKASGEALCKNRMTVYLRGAGGFSKSSSPYTYSNYPANQVLPIKIPKSQPFTVYEDCTQQSQALLYRLSGDYNPLHSDPEFATIAGFSRPILHGLCTLGFAVRAIVKCLCNGEPTLVSGIFGRFLLHVYPGETLVTEMWLEGSRVIYQTKVKERSRTALMGYVVLNRATSSM